MDARCYKGAVGSDREETSPPPPGSLIWPAAQVPVSPSQQAAPPRHPTLSCHHCRPACQSSAPCPPYSASPCFLPAASLPYHCSSTSLPARLPASHSLSACPTLLPLQAITFASAQHSTWPHHPACLPDHCSATPAGHHLCLSPALLTGGCILQHHPRDSQRLRGQAAAAGLCCQRPRGQRSPPGNLHFNLCQKGQPTADGMGLLPGVPG